MSRFEIKEIIGLSKLGSVMGCSLFCGGFVFFVLFRVDMSEFGVWFSECV